MYTIPSLYWLIVFNNSSRKCAWFSLGWASVGLKFRLKNFFIFTLRNYLKSFTKMIFVNKVQSIYKFGLSVCLFVSNNVKTAEPIGPKFFVWRHVTTGKVYEWSKFQIFVSIKIRSSYFWKFWKSTKFFVKIRELFLFCFTMYTKRTCSQLI